jgi:hypothetical protein
MLVSLEWTGAPSVTSAVPGSYCSIGMLPMLRLVANWLARVSYSTGLFAPELS